LYSSVVITLGVVIGYSYANYTVVYFAKPLQGKVLVLIVSVCLSLSVTVLVGTAGIWQVKVRYQKKVLDT